MIAIPKRPRPHQPDPNEQKQAPEKTTLKQQLINNVARGEVWAANELRELMRLARSEVDTKNTGPSKKSDESYAVWNDGDTVTESTILTATDGARELFDTQYNSSTN